MDLAALILAIVTAVWSIIDRAWVILLLSIAVILIVWEAATNFT